MEIILTHSNADFDAVASMLAAHKLYPQAQPILPPSQNTSVREFLALYRNGLPFIAWDDFEPDMPIQRVILTDTQRRPHMKQLPDEIPTLIIEHHARERELQPHETWMGDDLGAVTTLLVERIDAANIAITSLEATLMALGIYVDTGMLTYGRTTPRDIRAAAWLLEQGADLDTVRRFASHPLNDEQQELFEQLLDQIESRTIQGYDISLCRAHTDEHINGINSVTHRLQDILAADAVFVVVHMPEHVQLVCRSANDAIHVGEVAALFGGGGHPRAAAAAIHDADPDDIIQRIWAHLDQHVHAATTVADIMSHGDIQTVGAGETIDNLVPRLRRIGHEGYPVMDEEGTVVGLLTLRDADKALEHGLDGAAAKTIMKAGNITLHPSDSVATLEETMVANDWGQIPIVDDNGQLVGIVTRTDLISHWARTHPANNIPAEGDRQRITPDTLHNVLGDPTAQLIQRVADHAQQQHKSLYLVGGVVRDLLLQRRNLDVDFVVDSDAIGFAEHLCEQYGGSLHTHAPFGTAKWLLDDAAAAALGLSFDAIPDHLDFATTRSELYEHPTALPTVYSSSIKLDLRRRDFTINALAVQLSPAAQQWHLLDFYGGIRDLDDGVIRVLHSLSFIDDPTRILRAVRFSQRLNFTIDTRTADLIDTALPMLKRITGERLKNELSLLMQEKYPERGLLKLASLGALTPIHTEWHITTDIVPVFLQERESHPAWIDDDDHLLLRWLMMLAPLPPDVITAIGERLRFRQRSIAAGRATSDLVNTPDVLTDHNAPPSAIDNRLRDTQDVVLLAAWLWFHDDTTARDHIECYHDEWQHVQPHADGNTLKAMGLPPGPRYREILHDLRTAWLDGEITTADEETAYLQSLIEQTQNNHEAE